MTSINAISYNKLLQGKTKLTVERYKEYKKPYYGLLPRDGSEPERLRSLFGRLRFRSLEESDSSEEESDSESELEDVELDESLSELEDSESEFDAELDRLAFLRRVPLSFPLSSFDRSFSFASKILFAVPTGFLNSSGTSTEGFPSALSFASNFGFSSC